MRSEQLEVKVLLKQVYLAHTSKIKGLEDEIEELKTKLFQTDKKLKTNESECKRCAELEEAFKSCQTALHEQSKRFENIGQKFSVFDHPESKAASDKVNKDSYNISKIPGEVSCSSPLSCLLPEKSSSTKMNLLKNLMSLSNQEYQDSLDLGTAPFPVHFGQDYSTLNCDSMILAPDTMDIVNQIQSEKVKESCKDSNEKVDIKISKEKSKIESQNEGKSKPFHNTDRKQCQVASKPTKKRTLTESASSDCKTKKLHKNSVNEIDSASEEKKRRLTNKNGSSEAICIETKSLKEKKSPSEIKKKGNKNPKASICDISKMQYNDDNDVNAKNKNIPELDIQICKDVPNVASKSLEKTKACLSKDTSTTNNYQVSPSLLPLNDKKDLFHAKPLSDNEDISDFQTLITSKKQTSEEDNSWTACDKKKLKKGLPLKVKSSSKFKMSLDALPPNYKKPLLRQTKLSKSIFQVKAANANTAKENIPDTPSLTEKDCNAKGIGKNTVDFDATCIPDNYEYQIVPSGSRIQGKILDCGSANDGDVVVLNNESVDGSSNDSSLIINMNCINKPEGAKCHVNDEEDEKFEDFLKEGRRKLVCSENMNSFDRLPKKEEPNYKYKEETVRKKADRKQLNGFDCKECEKYYTELGLSTEEKQERLKQCSRHRSKFAPPATPEHFWELEFPDTQECKARGYMDVTQKVKLKTHRRKPL